MYWRGEINRLTEEELQEIAEKSTEVLESRKILMMDEWAEYALVNRKSLSELFDLIFGHGITNTAFLSKDNMFDEENH